jgi:hypothetical protein
MKKTTVFLFSGALVLLLTVWACGKDKESGFFNSPNTPIQLNSGDYKIAAKYDAEITVMTRAADPNDAQRLSPYDKINILPIKKRVGVQLGIKADGTSDWVIEKKKPEQPLEHRYAAPPNPRPQSAYFKISNNQMTTYDAKGTVLRSKELGVDEMSKMILDMTRNSPIATSLRSEDAELAALLQQAVADGAIVTASPDNKTYSIKKVINPNQYVVTMLDATMKKIKGVEIFQTNGEKMYSADLIYKLVDAARQQYDLSDIREVRRELAFQSQVPILVEKITHFLNFEVSGL